MQKFPRFGFRRNTHTMEGKYKKGEHNIWQVHIWDRSNIKLLGEKMPSNKALSFGDIVDICSNSNDELGSLDEEDISLMIIQMIECGLVEILQIDDYETDIYDEADKKRAMFWKGE